MLKRCFDIVVSVLFIIVCAPLLALIALLIWIEDGRPILFRQTRVGRDEKPFFILKFRSMTPSKGLPLTVGARDSRVTRLGYWLRRLKLDELPQLFNVLAGSMSLVGPRPEVPRYVALYNDEQRGVLSVRPGITDWASIHFIRENELLAESMNPEETYINVILPAKLSMNIDYIRSQSFATDLRILAKTLMRLVGQSV